MEKANYAEDRESEHVLRMIEIKRQRIDCLPGYQRAGSIEDLKDYVTGKLDLLLPSADTCPDKLKKVLREPDLPEWVREIQAARVRA